MQIYDLKYCILYEAFLIPSVKNSVTFLLIQKHFAFLESALQSG